MIIKVPLGLTSTKSQRTLLTPVALSIYLSVYIYAYIQLRFRVHLRFGLRAASPGQLEVLPWDNCNTGASWSVFCTGLVGFSV